jgi:hypothetical protein
MKAVTADLADQFGKLWPTAVDNGFCCGKDTREIFLLAVANAICVIRSFRFYPRDPRLSVAAGASALPELLDIADTAFTNNHCFSYAGRALIGTDSVVQVAFEPVPWLDRELDLKGTLYLKLNGYQIVGSFTRLNRLSPGMERSGLEEYFTEARFKEILPGVPIVDTWELVNRYRGTRPRFAQRGRVIDIIWK